ncbi:FecR family protein [Chitinophaga defluvii]|uniref:FecR domain-containing protein n=1 Tax=Chitinophaga defluvii TaxID=3163343 RepID=A0ABV2T0A8_9BACT
MNEQQLTELIERYLEGTATQEEREKVEQWYAGFDDYTANFYNGDAAKIAASAQKSLALIRQQLSAAPARQPVQMKRRMGWTRIAAAAVVLLFAGVATYFFLYTPRVSARIIVKNAAGQVRQVLLPDSSVVWLNSHSEIQYLPDFSDTAREVFLSGEGFFEIRPESKRPFLVHCQEITTRVLGTSFNVNAYRELDTMAITLLTGKVAISSSGKVLGVLAPDQQLSYYRTSGKVVTAQVSADALGAWKEGKLQFDDCSMEQIATTLERWYGYKFSFEYDQLKKCRYSASFENTIPLKDLLDILRQVSNVQYDLDAVNKSVVFKGKHCNN